MRTTVVALLGLLLPAPALAQVVTNGDFESGPLSTGWTTHAIAGGGASVVLQGTQFSTFDTTTGIRFPSPTHALNVRSNPGGAMHSVGVVRSQTFVVTRQRLSWQQRSERDAVAIEARLLDAANDLIQTAALTPSVGAFVPQELDVADSCGATRRIELRQSTVDAGSAWFTLFDDVALSGDLCEAYVDRDGDGYCREGRDFNGDGDCASAGEPIGAADCDDTDATISPAAFDTPGDDYDSDCSGDFLCYVDTDGDGAGNEPGFVVISPDAACDAHGESLSADDCDDLNAGIRPGATDTPGNAVDEDCDADLACFVDGDGDGYGGADLLDAPTCAAPGLSWSGADCDDLDANVSPAGDELAGNTTDEDCDGTWTCFLDADLDGFGGPELVISADASCADPGEATAWTDCDDASELIRPDALDAPADGIDQDCDGRFACFADADLDGHGDPAAVVTDPDPACATPGSAARATDCDDARADVSPDGLDLPADGVDQDCDGLHVCWGDADEDTWGTDAALAVSLSAACDTPGAAPRTGDCDDTAASTSPDATDTAGDAVDDDCDGRLRCYVDLDLDTWGDPASTDLAPALDCAVPGLAARAGDCDDTSAETNPAGADRLGDGIDQDCDGLYNCWPDEDGDGFGRIWLPNVSTTADCSDPGTSLTYDDCDDEDPTVNPDGVDRAGDDVDQDCDGDITCWLDGDLDGWGRREFADALIETCRTAGWSASARDCDDTDAAIRPFAVDLPADGVDSDCDGLDVCYVDADEDTFGGALLVTAPTCDAAGVADNNLDCNDNAAQTRPDAEDLPGDAIDQDCDGLYACFIDADLDGIGGPTVIDQADPTCAAPGISPRGDDCDDLDPNVAPGLADLPADGVDRDCDGAWSCWADPDGDGFGAPGLTVPSDDADCDDPGEADNADDCGDDPNVYPGAPERCADGGPPVDEDCDGLADDADPDVVDPAPWFRDVDADGWGAAFATTACVQPAGTAAVDGDCDDRAPATNPAGTDLPADGIDQDCDGQFRCWVDRDGDGQSAPGSGQVDSPARACDLPGVSATLLDCDDDDDDRFAGNPEAVADGVDQDCDGRETCWLDQDGDMHGNLHGSTVRVTALDCRQAGASPDADDCNDRDGTVYPGAPELPARGIDNDCSGDWLCVLDADLDGWGNAGGVTVVSADIPCSAPGEAATISDCDDADPAVFPGAAEIVGNDVDEDCSGDWQCYADGDLDGHGRMQAIVSADPACDAPGEAAAWTDCDDSNPAIHPGALDLPANGQDEDCDGAWVCWLDADADGFGNDDGETELAGDPGCAAAGASLTATDCDDLNAAVFPGATEVYRDGVDQDCDGVDPGVDTAIPVLDTDTGDTDGADPEESGDPATDDTDGETDLNAETDLDTDLDTDPGDEILPDKDGWYGGGCDCDHRGPAPTGLLPAAALALWLRRRAR